MQHEGTRTGAGLVVAQTTVDDEAAALELARGAVAARLAACAHVDAPIRAVYRWEGEVRTDTEWRISFKTPEDRVAELGTWLHAHHPYDLPQWLVLPTTDTSPAYLAWATGETRPET
ncbi:divalent-cation tolerance protein CutA [Streptomyces sp. NPDC097619]|uniref:divalent-cation tolerance protein CutA n=1 Tax=Streptomyces sp. NPDC097619 TaxID=3157228 RepID=UPI003321B369